MNCINIDKILKSADFFVLYNLIICGILYITVILDANQPNIDLLSDS